MPSSPDGVLLRPRADEDVPELARLLLAQQPTTGYPMRNPLPVPGEQFVARPRDLAAWVVEVDGVLAGHVAVDRVEDGEIGRAFAAATGMPLARLGSVSTLFVGPGRAGLGLGGRLLGTAVRWARLHGLLPVLDVFPGHAAARALYLRRGWRDVATLRPGWVPDHADDLVLMVLPDSA
ncbi:GNAT family N-acetyltransferase [uncultured Serinicoccus sp.]|uniref:GNAT family N-acetyltransferase n=1 Tax=uncultured Serinicoccus sp. TaxID=735514 RepID=UPI0026240519|nr:GNAT family N-acetyltransferase [uncultured Serinicoccus sp.]